LVSPLACASGVTGSDLKKRIEAIMSDRIAQGLTPARRLLLAVAGIAAVAGPILIGVVNAPPSRAQSKTEALTFEVASIRPAAPQPDRRVFSGFGNDPGRFTATNVTVRDVLMRVYQVRAQQITGPAWIDADRYDIVAKLPEGATRDHIAAMIRNLLVERFKLSLRVERKETPVYVIQVGKSGPKLTEAVDGDEPAAGKTIGITISDGRLPGLVRIEGHKTTLSRFAIMLSRVLDRPVVDQTRLPGIYDFTLEVGASDLQMKKPGAPPPEAAGGGKGEGGPAPDTAPATSIFSAIQHLGLRLETKKAPLDMIIVEKGERVPTAN